MSLKIPKKFPITTEIVEKAHQRYLTGAPPCSDNKNAIGDQINWESILHNLKDDLIIVSRDNTYADNRFLLNEEYSKTTGKTILAISDTITQAVKLLGKEPNPDALQIEERIKEEEKIDEVNRGTDRFTILRDMLSTCPYCGSTGQNGSKCRNCGYNMCCD